MKKLKYAFWLLLVVFIGLLVYQNLAFFSTKQSLHINLGFYEKSTPELTIGAIIAVFVGIGVLITLMFYFASRYDNFRSKKTIKELKNQLEESVGTMSQLKQEVALIKGDAPAAVEPAPADQGDAPGITVETPETETEDATEDETAATRSSAQA